MFATPEEWKQTSSHGETDTASAEGYGSFCSNLELEVLLMVFGLVVWGFLWVLGFAAPSLR